MAKFLRRWRRSGRTDVTAPVTQRDEFERALRAASVRTMESVRPTESELFLQAATNTMGDDPTDERGAERDARFVDLVHETTARYPSFISGRDPDAGRVGLAQYVRQAFQRRSAAVVLAAEYVAAGGANARGVVDRVLQHPGDPAEMLAYWLAHHGRAIPAPLKRGVADAVRRMYDERGVLRYDGRTRNIRMADVIELVHPKPKDARQSALFEYLLDRRHHNTGVADPSILPMLAAAQRLEAVPEDERRELLRRRGADALAAVGSSWEHLSRWLPGGMDAEAWEAAIPSMDTTALVRNLRNFDEAGISEAATENVVARITDLGEVIRARLLPYQVWDCYVNAPSDDWRSALGTTLEHTIGNIAPLHYFLVVIDASRSMKASVTRRSRIRRVEVAALMAMASVKRSRGVDVVIFGDEYAPVRPLAGSSVLSGVRRIVSLIGSVGDGTYGYTAIAAYATRFGYRRVALFTDEQQQDAGDVNLDHIPVIYTFNLAGHEPSPRPSLVTRRYGLGGFTDATFTAMQVLEDGWHAAWRGQEGGEVSWPF